MLVVITGPSGVGKTTIINRLLEFDPHFQYSTSITTRSPRHDEIDGVDYFFVTREEFQKSIDENQFAEWSEVYGHYYGRLKRDLECLMKKKDVVVGIDVQGAIKLQDIYPQGIYIFMLPASEVALENQLRGRRTEGETSLKTRLAAALQEMKHQDKFSYIVVNKKVNNTVKQIQNIIFSEKNQLRAL